MKRFLTLICLALVLIVILAGCDELEGIPSQSTSSVPASNKIIEKASMLSLEGVFTKYSLPPSKEALAKTPFILVNVGMGASSLYMDAICDLAQLKHDVYHDEIWDNQLANGVGLCLKKNDSDYEKKCDMSDGTKYKTIVFTVSENGAVMFV